MRFLSAVFACVILSGIAGAQEQFVGDWSGVLKAGSTDLHITFHISDSSAATMDVKEQGAFGIPASGLVISGDSIRINLSKLNAYYLGVLNSTGNITGSWNQSGLSMLLNLSKGALPAATATRNRPQTPVPPFSYISEDLIFYSADSAVQYGATLTLPKGKGPYPALLLVTGSGKQNRDEELFGHKPFAVIADYLTKNGYAVLRVDDRGAGETTGGSADLTSADFVADAGYAIDYLKTRKEVDAQKIGIAGHSEGGMVAQMLATQRKDIDFLVLLAAPGIKAAELMTEQNAAVLRNNNAAPEIVTAYMGLYREITQAVLHAKTKEDIRVNIASAIKTWRANTDSMTVVSTIGVSDNSSEQVVSERIAQQFMSPWVRYFLAYDPAPYLQRLNAKVLALNGNKDIQVISASNLKGIEEGLKKSPSKQYTVKEMPGLNHLFQTCNKCTVAEYAELDETFSPTALSVMHEWLDRYVK